LSSVLYIQKSYPGLILEFEEQTKPKKKPSKTTKSSKANSGDTQQLAITKFFAQGKTKQPSKPKEKCPASISTKKSQPILKTIVTNKVEEVMIMFNIQLFKVIIFYKIPWS
jgi:hypothetical protein